MKKAIVAFGLFLAGCDDRRSDIYTLYRDSIAGNLRIHMATFDADDQGNYNEKNCHDIADLINKSNVGPEGIVVRYWCEKGHFRE